MKWLAWRLDRWLMVGSLAWLGVVLATSLVQSPVALGLTAALVVANFVVSTVALFREKRILVLLNLTQVLVFGVLFYQVYAALGPDNYSFSTAPGFLDWAQFCGIHLLRAADVFDFLESFGISLQNVRHESVLVGVLLVSFHLMADLFFLGLLLKAVTWSWGRLTSGGRTPRWWTSFRRFSSNSQVQYGALMALMLLMFGVFWWFGVSTDTGSGWDQWLWNLDNLVRVVDVGDVMQIFHWRLHGVRENWPTVLLGVGVRLLAGSILFGWFAIIRLKVLKDWAPQTVEDYARDLGDRSPTVRRSAAQALGDIGPRAVAAVPDLVVYLASTAAGLARTDEDVKDQAAAEAALSKIDPNWAALPAAREALPGLLEGLESGEGDMSKTMAFLNRIAPDWAASVLGQIGPPARDAVPSLVERLTDDDWRVVRTAVKALKQIEPDWGQSDAVPSVVARLTKRLRHGDGTTRLAAAWALSLVGPAARASVPALRKLLGRRDLGYAAERALDAIVHGTGR